MKTLLFILLCHSLSSYAVEPMDNYYADDLLDAVNQAKEQPHHYDYSSTYRYKRTTAQSIELNRLNLNELDDTRLEIQGKSAELIPDAGSNDDLLSLKETDDVPADTANLITPAQTIIPVNTQYESRYGSHYSTGVINQGSLVSTPRP
jgi:flagellar hook-length control protein FliK